MVRLLIVFALSISVASCASFNAPLDYKLNRASGKGLAVFSLTTEGVFNNFYIMYRDRQGGNVDGDISLFTRQTPLDWDSIEKGRIIILELPEGEYELYRVSNIHYSSLKFFSIPFDVKSGKIVYFGNVHVNIPNTDYFKYTVQDRSVRDLNLLFSRYKKLSRKDLVKM